MADSWLSPGEVKDLTNKTRWTAQCRTLAGMHIPFKPNAAGRPLVERTAVFDTPTSPARKRKVEPKWEALHKNAA